MSGGRHPAGERDLVLSALHGRRLRHCDLPPSDGWLWPLAAARSLRCLARFRRGGSVVAARDLAGISAPLRRRRLLQRYPAHLVHAAACRDIATLRAIVRLLTREERCLPLDLAICAGARSLGYAASVVVGRAAVACYLDTPLHSWIEVRGEPVTEPPQVRLAFDAMIVHPATEAILGNGES